MRRRLPNRLLGVITIGVVAALIVGDFTGVLRGAFGGGGRTVKAVFSDTQQLTKGDFVRIQGVDVGHVTGIRLDPGARHATVTMSLDSSAGPLYADARASLRWRTVLGASYAMSLDRGTPSAGSLGSQTIPLSRTSNQVELDDVAAFDRGSVQRGLQTIPGELARALRDPQPPTQALGTLADISPAVTTGVGALRGQTLDSDLRTAIAASARTVRALDAPNNELQTLVAAASATLRTTAIAGGDISTTIAQAPATLQSADTTVKQLNTTLRAADPLIARLTPTAPAIASTVAQLHPTVTGLDGLLRKAVPLLDALRPAVGSLADAARRGLPLLENLTPSFDRVNNTILPYLGETDPGTQHTTSEMIGGTFTGLGSGATAQMDANGHFIRFPVTAGSSPLYLPCQTYYGNPDKAKLVECQSLEHALQTYLSYSPLGPPRTTP